MTRSTIETLCLVFLALFAGSAALIYTKAILIPFVLAIGIACIVTPVIGFFERRCRLPRVLAMLVTSGCVVGMIAIFFALMSGAIKDLFDNVQTYQDRLIYLSGQTLLWLDSYGIQTSQEELLQSLRELPFFDYARQMAGRIVNMANATFLVIIFVVFVLSGPSLGEAYRNSIVAEIDRKIRTYLVAKTLTSLATGTLTAIILAIVGIDMAVMFGLLAFVLNFIPTVGSLIATILPLPIAILEFQEVWRIALALLGPGSVQMIIGNVLEPKFMGDSLDLHPVTVMMSLMFWGLIWGVPGMLLATPFAVIIKICLTQVEGGKIFAEIMAGRFRAFVDQPAKT